MTKKKRFGISEALTRGLSETINVVENNTGVFRNIILPLSRIELDPDNPRKLAITLDDVRNQISTSDPRYAEKQAELEKLKELAHTIKTNGVINPVVVYKLGETYRVVAGERRCLASILAGKQEIEARVFSEKPKGFELKLIQWVENTAREDLSLAERLGNINEIITEYKSQFKVVDVSATALKNITGLSLPQTSYYLSVLNGPQDVLDHVESGQIKNLDKAAILANIENDTERKLAIEACIDGASLKNIRYLVNQAKPKTKTRQSASSKVNLGSTNKPKLVKTIIHAVLKETEMDHHLNFFNHIDWDNTKQTTLAFKKFIALLEKEMAV